MGGRGSSSGLGGGGNKYTDSTDFKTFQRENREELKAVFKAGGMDAVKEAWYETRVNAEMKNAHEMSVDDAIDTVRDAIPQGIWNEWFINANSNAKPKLIESIMGNEGTMNAGWNIAYKNYVDSLPEGTKAQSFNKWLKTPQTLYRGDRGQSTVKNDVFSSYTADKKVAAGFTLSGSGGGVANVRSDFSNIDQSRIKTIKIRPIDTWGSYQTTAEQEYLVPAKRLRK